MGSADHQSAAQKGAQTSGCQAALQARRGLKPERLPKSRRLGSASDFKAVFESGRRRRTPRLDFVWRPNDSDHPRLGVIVPRYGATAVVRNRLRRRIREAARRMLLPNLSAIDLVVRARPAAYRSSTAELTGDLEEWLRSVSE